MNVLIGVGAQLKLARLLLTTDARTEHGDLVAFLTAAVSGGVDVLRIQQSGLDHDAELATLRTAWDVAHRHRHLVLVDDSAELAADFGADAVQLSRVPNAAELAAVRSRLGRFTRIGGTAGDSAELQRLFAEPGIDFLMVDAGTDLELVAEAAERAPVGSLESKPWYAAGEFDPARLEEAIDIGVRRIAVRDTLTGAADPHGTARQLSRRLREVWSSDPELTRLTFATLADQS